MKFITTRHGMGDLSRVVRVGLLQIKWTNHHLSFPGVVVFCTVDKTVVPKWTTYVYKQADVTLSEPSVMYTELSQTKLLWLQWCMNSAMEATSTGDSTIVTGDSTIVVQSHVIDQHGAGQWLGSISRSWCVLKNRAVRCSGGYAGGRLVNNIRHS